MLLFSLKSIGQNSTDSSGDIMGTIITSGNSASGSSGTVTYSIGQIFYTYIGESVYNVAQGIQHEQKVESLIPKEELIDVKTEISIYPNPTTDFVNINMTGFEIEIGQPSFQLYDLHGRLLQQKTINESETQISLNNLSSALYILQVSVNNEVFKTFKIIKK